MLTVLAPAPGPQAGAAPAGAGPSALDSLLGARHQGPDAPIGVHPALAHGTLLLSGGADGDRAAMARFLALAGGAGGRIVVIPSASVAPGDAAAARLMGERMARRLGVRSVRVMHAASRAEADSRAFVTPLGDATGVWITGGDGARLVDLYLGTRTETALEAVLRRGVVIAGTGAGALVWGSEVLMYHTPPGGDAYARQRAEDLVSGDPGATTFGWLRRTVIAAHYTRYDVEPSLRRAVRESPYLLGIGLDDDTAVEIHHGVMRLLGGGYAYVLDAREPGLAPIELRGGALYDLTRRVAF